MTDRDPIHVHLEIPQDAAERLPQGEELSCRVVREDDGTLVLCVGLAGETSPEVDRG